MKENDRVLHDVAAAMMNGVPIDWASAESRGDDESMRRVVRELRVIAAIAEVHGTSPISACSPSVDAEPGNVSAAEQPFPTTWGALRLLEQLGEGAFGSVYRAWDTRLDREVALKLLHRPDTSGPDEGAAVVDEGRMLARVHHPNVVIVHGADRSDGRVGVWTEFIHGQTLEQLLRERGVLGAGEATLIGLDVCRALSAVHQAGLLHRDVKAHNVMREHGGRIVLMDFGTGIHHGDSLDAIGSLAGTPVYMAPEVLDGRPATVRSDVYSVGVLLYHLVTGSYPVRGHSVQEIRAGHSRGERILLRNVRSNLADDFVQIVERALSPEPDRRYESVGEMAAALVSAKDGVAYVGAATRSETFIRPAVELTSPLQSVKRTSWRRRILSLAILVALAGAGTVWLTVRKSDAPVIAVLPFKNLSTEPDSDYFVDGLTDEVIRNLSVIDGLSVRSSASSFAFKNKNPSARDLSTQLNANLILSASVLRQGTRLRIDAQLVRAADDVPLWSGRYDRELKDVFAIQDEISRSIVNELRLKLGRGQRRYAANVDAYDRYLKARVLQSRRGPATRQAIDLFDEVVAKDPGFAPAYAARASAYGWYLVAQVPSVGGLPLPPDQAREIVRHDALEALRLDPLLAEAHDATGWVHSLDLEWAEAEKSFRRAIELNPSVTISSTDFVVAALLPEGKLDEALRVLNDAVHADPLSPEVRRAMSMVQISTRQYDAALVNCRRAIALDREIYAANTRCEQALIQKGEVAEAITMMEKFIADTPALKEGGGRGYGYLGYAYAISGRRAEAEAQAVRNEGLPHQQAIIYAGLGDKERAWAAIEQLAALNPQRALSWLTRPELDLLHGDPRVVALRQKFGVLH